MQEQRDRRRARVWVAFIALGTFVASAEAQVGSEGSPITTSDYTVDLTRGVVISTSRVIGLGGAATALARGVEGGLQNPAAVAYRGPQWPEWYDYWLALGVTYPFKAGDFYNSGQIFGNSAVLGDDTQVFLIPGAYFQMWNLGIGLTIDSQFTTIPGVENPATMQTETLRLRFTTFHLQAGYGFLGGQLIVAGGLRIVRQRNFLSTSAFNNGDVYRTLGLSAEIGLMLRPHHERWSLGAAVFPRVSTTLGTQGSVIPTPGGDIVVAGYYLPRSTTIPTSGSVGFAYRFGPRPTNPPWISDEELAEAELERFKRRREAAERAEQKEIAATRARGGPDVDLCVRVIEQKYARKYAEIKQARREMKKLAWETLRGQYRSGWPRRYYLLTADVGFNGRVTNGVSVESFVFQTVQRSGQRITVSPHVGFETEAWPKRMKIRAGTYLEPTRVAESTPRAHGTLGFDINLFKWNVFGLWPDDYRWQLTGALDLARAYGSFSLGVGGWY